MSEWLFVLLVVGVSAGTAAHVTSAVWHWRLKMAVEGHGRKVDASYHAHMLTADKLGYRVELLEQEVGRLQAFAGGDDK